MRLNDAPEHECPGCEEHPSLVYESSVGPARAGRPGEDVVRHDHSFLSVRNVRQTLPRCWFQQSGFIVAGPGTEAIREKVFCLWGRYEGPERGRR